MNADLIEAIVEMFTLLFRNFLDWLISYFA